MPGLYIHIPFCRQACIYCNFHFSTALKNKTALLDALQQEMELQQHYFPEKAGLDTLYFGGGTPSLLSAAEIKKLLATADELFAINENAEITLEGNPDDLSRGKLRALKSAGINRLSIGIQSFFDRDLRWMNRAHDGKQAVQCLQEVYAAGFANFSADLIFGIPGLTDRQWQENISRMLHFEVPHLSCYALTLEPRTSLAHLIHTNKMPPLDEEQAARQFEILMERLSEAGYEQYEISNFAKPGYRSRHNSSYWKGIPYLGIGPAAHSFRPQERQWNVANNARYIKSIQSGVLPCEKEILHEALQWDEYIMTALRTIEGCDRDYIVTHFGAERWDWLVQQCQPFIRAAQLILINNRIVLTSKGKLFADGIAAELFV